MDLSYVRSLYFFARFVPFFQEVRRGGVTFLVLKFDCGVALLMLTTNLRMDASPKDVPNEHQHKTSTSFYLGLGMWIGYFANRLLCVRELLIYWNSSDIK